MIPPLVAVSVGLVLATVAMFACNAHLNALGVRQERVEELPPVDQDRLRAYAALQLLVLALAALWVVLALLAV